MHLKFELLYSPVVVNYYLSKKYRLLFKESLKAISFAQTTTFLLLSLSSLHSLSLIAKMIDSTLEFVNKTTSNSLFMFLFCNVIIILILMGNSKPGSEDKLGSKEPMLVSESVLSSKSMLLSESRTLNSKADFKKPVLIPESVLSSKPVLVSESVLSSKPGLEKPELISDSTLPLNSGLQEPEMISKSVGSSQPVGSDQSLTSKPGLNVISSGLKLGSDCLEKEDERGRMRKKESLEVENESLEVERVLRRRAEEFIRKVNTQWKLENTRLLY